MDSKIKNHEIIKYEDSNKTFTCNSNFSTYLLRDSYLLYWELNSEKQKWEEKSRKLIIDNSTSNPFIVANFPEISGPVFIIRTGKGVEIYHYEKELKNLNLISRDLRFHDSFAWNKPEIFLIFGKIYQNLGDLGVFTRHLKHGVKFYAISGKTILPERKSEENGEYSSEELDIDLPLWDVKIERNSENLVQNSDWMDKDTKFLIDAIKNGEKQENLILYSKSGILEIFKFDSNYKLQKLFNKIILERNGEKLLFLNIKKDQVFKNILLTNENGLFLYEFNKNLTFSILAHSSEFSNLRGWDENYRNSIKVIDIENDNINEIIFNSPSGLSAAIFNLSNKIWEFILESGPDFKYSKVLNVFPSVNNCVSQTIFLEQNAQISPTILIEKRITKIPEIIGINDKNQEDVNFKFRKREGASLPNESHRLKYSANFHLPLSENLDMSNLLNAVNIGTGQIRFSLPLSIGVNLKTPLTISYNSQETNGGSSLLGNKWSLESLDFITFFDGGSIYFDDKIFYISSSSKWVKLKEINIENQDQNTHYILENSDKNDIENVTIIYNTIKSYWTVENEKFKNVYGVDSDSIQWGLIWSNWHGPGKDAAGQKQIPISWYLSERLDKITSKSTFYKYECTLVQIPNNGKYFTESIRLKSIVTGNSGENFSLSFKYGLKANSEIDPVSPLIDSDNYINAVPVERHFLESYELKTLDYIQKIEFVYKNNEGIRDLVKINQIFDENMENVIQFEYKTISETDSVLKTVSLKNGDKFSFELENSDHFWISLPKSYSTEFNSPSLIVSGPGYILIAELKINSGGHLNLKILNPAGTESLIDSDIKYGSNFVQFNLTPYKEFFIVQLTHFDWKIEILLFRRDESETWTKIPTIFQCGQNDNKEVQIVSNENLVVVLTRDNLFCIEWKKEKKIWTKFNLSFSRFPKRIALENKIIFIYDDSDLWIFYYKNNNWEKKIIKHIPNFYFYLDKTLSKFDLGFKSEKETFQSLNSTGLKVANNLILLSTIKESSGKLLTIIHLFLLDTNYNLVKDKSFSIEQENLLNLFGELDIFHDETQSKQTLKLGYVLNDKQFQIKFFDFLIFQKNKSLDVFLDDQEDKELLKLSGKNYFLPLSSNEKKVCKKTFKDKTISEFQTNFLKGTEKAPVKIQLMNWLKYEIHFSKRKIICGNLKIIFSGLNWATQILQEEEALKNVLKIKLGDFFFLEKTSKNSTFKLFNKDKILIKDLQTKYFEKIVNRFPSYLAYETDSGLAHLLIFSNFNTIGFQSTFPGEHIYIGSPFSSLITYPKSIRRDSTGEKKTSELRIPGIRGFKISPFTFQYKIRSISAPGQSLSHKVVKMTSENIFRPDEGKRETGFEYFFPEKLPNGLSFYKKTHIIPGGDKSFSGYIEIRRSFNYTTKNFDTDNIYFDVESQIVEKVPEKDKENMAEKEFQPNSNTTILDKTGNLIISDFSPYSIRNEQVGYFGFESYEVNVIGLEKKWIFNNSAIIRNKFAFTGESYLHMSSGESLMGIFEPFDQTSIYVLSSWIRPEANYLENITEIPSNIMKAKIIEKNEEILTLFGSVKKIYETWLYFELQINLQELREIFIKDGIYPLFKIQAEISSLDNQILNIDHIRFSPAEIVFQANIYDPIFSRQTGQIKTNGAINKIIFNQIKGMPIAVISENGVLSSFSSTSPGNSLIFPSEVKFQPESGFYENFDRFSLSSRWEIDSSAVSAWTIAPGQLIHKSPQMHKVKANQIIFHKYSSAIRFNSVLLTQNSSIQINFDDSFFLFSKNQILIKTSGKLIFQREILKKVIEVILMLEKNRIFLWINGNLLLDHLVPDDNIQRFVWRNVSFEMEGNCIIEDLFVLNNPFVSMQYFNSWGDKTQSIELEDSSTSLVSEMVYDRIGRLKITTKSTRIQNSISLLKYFGNFIIKNGTISGLVHTLNLDDDGVPFHKIEYEKNPLSRKIIEGSPGLNFSVEGPWAKKFNYSTKMTFLLNKFPPDKGFRFEIEHWPNGSEHCSIFDSKNNIVGLYTHVPGTNHIFSTYEYNNFGNLVKILPPLYHEKVGSLFQTSEWKTGEIHLGEKEHYWQEKLGHHMKFEKELLIEKKIPDSGKIEYFYDSFEQLRFVRSLDINNISVSNSLSYFNYNYLGQLVFSGEFIEPDSISKNDLENFLKNEISGLSGLVREARIREVQKIFYNDADPDPEERGKIKRMITYNSNSPVIEEVIFNENQRIIFKKVISPWNHNNMALEKEYSNGGHFVKKLKYPVLLNGVQFEIRFIYNKLGKLTGIGNREDPYYYAKYHYYATGEIQIEEHSKTFNRTFSFNSPGFLTQISDPFLAQSLFYTEQGYGQNGYGDGIIMKTKFESKWTGNPAEFEIKEDALMDGKLITSFISKSCIQALKKEGYLSLTGIPIKEFVPNLDYKLPIICNKGSTGLKLAEITAEKLKTIFGHSYAYGNHQELIKAKFFTGNSSFSPLSPETFSNELGIRKNESLKIWEDLTKSEFIIQDKIKSGSVFGSSYKSLFKKDSINKELEKINPLFTTYTSMILKTLSSFLTRGEYLSLNKFQEIYNGWHINSRNRYKNESESIWNILKSKNYLKLEYLLNEDLLQILPTGKENIIKITKVLLKHFGESLCQNPFDLESFEIDGNGNHKKFYRGYNRYEFFYKNGTNQIESVQKDRFSLPTGQNFMMTHDSFGRVTQALHMEINNIIYYPLNHRVAQIEMESGQKIQYAYDGSGERIFKGVLSQNGLKEREIYYIRDEEGKILVENEKTYFSNPEIPPVNVVTTFIYGERGLLGFYRKNSFYNVITDHEGSIRLVVKNGQVEAAYDYMPYGQLMRKYGGNPDAQIRFRYTGQEYDEETGLYNYHARLYDPSIGRFYQIDPKEQYFSPYKYAGNSPVSFVDPDGQEAVTIILAIVFAIIGAYIAGAAANNDLRIWKWDWTSEKTWLAIIGGAITGALLPGGVAGTFGVLTAAGLSSTTAVATTIALGSVGAYLSLAAAGGSFDPSKWNLNGLEALNAIFQGFAIGVNLVNAPKSLHKFAQKFSTFGAKSAVYGSGVVLGLGASYVAGMSVNNWNPNVLQWDWSNPATLFSILASFDTGVDIFSGVGNFARKGFQNGGKFLKYNPLTTLLKQIKKNPKIAFKILAIAPAAFLMGSLSSGSFTSWNAKDFNTYEGILNGIFLGKNLGRIKKVANLKAKISAKIDIEIIKLNKGLKKVFKNFENFIWYKNLDSDLGKIEKIGAGIVFKNLMDNFFRAFAGNFKILKLDFDLKFKGELELFFKKGLKAWENGESVPPKNFNLMEEFLLKKAKGEVLDDSKKLSKWSEDTNLELEKKTQIYTDRDLDNLVCSGSFGSFIGRRKKRGVTNAKINKCSIPTPDLSKQREFKETPEEFMKKNEVLTVSTKFNNVKFDEKIFISFDKDSTGGFNLKLSNVESEGSIEGYWLITKESMLIGREGPKFLFTPELQGCTLYTKYDPITNLIEVFHHYRPFEQVIFVNGVEGVNLKNQDVFINSKGKSIPELAGKTELFDKYNRPLKIVEGTIKIPDSEIYYKDKGNLIKIDKLDGKSVEGIIKENQRKRAEVLKYDSEYTGILKYEEYSGVPLNYAVKEYALNYPQAVGTPVLIRNENGVWNWVVQKNFLTIDPIDGNWNYKINEKSPIFIKQLDVPPPVKFENAYLKPKPPDLDFNFENNLLNSKTLKDYSNGGRSMRRKRNIFMTNLTIKFGYMENLQTSLIATSGAAHCQYNNWFNLIPPYLFAFLKGPIYNIPNYFLNEHEKIGVSKNNTNLGFAKNFKKEKVVKMQNCFSLSPKSNFENEFSSKIVCFSDNFFTTIFHTEKEFNFSEDTFNNCVPIEYNGHSSVICKGEKSNMVYTPVLQPKIFDPLDGWIMLSAIAINSIKNCIFSSDANYIKNKVDKRFVSANDVKFWRNKLILLESKINSLTVDKIDEIWKNDVKWAKYKLEDRKSDFEILSQSKDFNDSTIDSIIFDEDLNELEIMLEEIIENNSHDGIVEIDEMELKCSNYVYLGYDQNNNKNSQLNFM